MLYTEEDYQTIVSQLKRRRLCLYIPFVLVCAGIIALAVVRVDEKIVMALTILAVGAFIFCGSLLVRPVACYKKHLDNVMHGRTHIVCGAFKSMDEDPTNRDGVTYRAVIVNVGRMSEEKDDRLLYYDALLPIPPWKEGDMLKITAHDKAIGAWERAE